MRAITTTSVAQQQQQQQQQLLRRRRSKSFVVEQQQQQQQQQQRRRKRQVSIQTKAMTSGEKVQKSDAEWKKELTSQQYQVLRLKGTEPARTGEYDKFYPSEGHFVCAGCGNPLYSAESKFNSGCGWPAFDKCYEGSVGTNVDNSFGMRRVEIVCAKCDGHLGHVFENEGFTPTAERHCVNSVSVKYVEGKCDQNEAKVIDGTSIAGGAQNALSMLIRPALYFTIGYTALNVLAHSASSFMTRSAQ